VSHVLLAIAHGSVTPLQAQTRQNSKHTCKQHSVSATKGKSYYKTKHYLSDHVVWALAGRLCVSHNTRLGVYDPIRNVWQVPPSNVEEHDEQMRLKAHGHIPTKRKVPTSPNVGGYDPVR